MTTVIAEDNSFKLKMDKAVDYRDRVLVSQVKIPVEGKSAAVPRS